MLELHPNDNAREGRPGIWIFSGSSVVFLVVGVGVFVALFRILDSAGVDWYVNIFISLLPLAGLALYTWCFVKDKAPSYSQDLLGWRLFRIRQWLYKHGVLERPPAFWIRPGALPVPAEFNKEEQ